MPEEKPKPKPGPGLFALRRIDINTLKVAVWYHFFVDKKGVVTILEPAYKDSHIAMVEGPMSTRTYKRFCYLLEHYEGTCGLHIVRVSEMN